MRFLITAILVFHALFGKAQVNTPYTADMAFDVLKNGFVVVRLHVNKRKMDYYEKQLQRTDLSKKEFDAFQRKYIEFKVERENYIRKTMFAFDNYLKFCPVYYYYDFDHNKIVDGILPSGIFINEDGHYDQNIIPPQKNYLIIARKESEATISANSGLVVLDPSNLEIPKPFPQPKSIPSIFLWFSQNSPEYSESIYYDKALDKMLNKWVIRLNKSKNNYSALNN
jgi:hypothetical protein